MIEEYERLAEEAYRKFLFRDINLKQYLEDMGAA